MERFAKDENVGWTIKNYGDGLHMLKAGNGTAGRCLFFVANQHRPPRLIALLFYKKESRDAPTNLLETARHRMKAFIEPEGDSKWMTT